MKFFLDSLRGKPPAERPARPSGLADLTPGREVRATVAGPAPGGLTEIKLMGQSLWAETQLPLQTGQSLRLTVERVSPELVLSLASAALAADKSRLSLALMLLLQGRERLAAQLGGILAFDAEQTPPPTPRAAQLLAELRELAGGLAREDDEPVDREWLPKLLKRTGLDLEARLARHLTRAPAGAEPPRLASLRVTAQALAGELSGRLAALAGEDPPRAAALRELLANAQGLAALYDANAQLNAELWPQRKSLLLALPLLMGGRIDPGELLIDLASRERHPGEEGETRLVFFLTLSALGPLAIEARVCPGRIQGEIITDHPEKARFLEGLLPELTGALAALGFAATFSVRAQPEEELGRRSPLAELIRQGGHYLSLTV